MKVASLSQIGLIAGPFNLLLAQAVYLIQAGLNLLLDTKRDFECQGSDRADQNLSDRLVKVLTVDVLAHRDDMVGSVALAYIGYSSDVNGLFQRDVNERWTKPLRGMS